MAGRRMTERANGLPVQRGTTLVSLLVATAVSLLCVVAALQAFRTAVLGARGSADAVRQANLSSALALQLGKLLPAAGWGLGASASPPGGVLNQDFVLLTGAALNSGTLTGTRVSIGAPGAGGNAVVWASRMDGVTTRCSALLASTVTGLVRLGPKNCASVQAALDSTWATQSSLAPAGNYGSGLRFQVTSSNCWPLGGALIRSGAQVELLNARGTFPAICLPNIHG